MARALRKTKKPPKIAEAKPIRIRIGTPNSYGPWQEYRTEAEARRAMSTSIESWKPWCQRYNTDGLAEIDATVAALDGITFLHEAKRITCCFDEHTGTTWAAEYRREF